MVRPGALNAKYSPGGLLDAEYMVQSLQVRHGAALSGARHPSILLASAALAESGVLTPADYARFKKGYLFLRALINALRIVRGNAKDLDIPKPDTIAYATMVRRLALFEQDLQPAQSWPAIVDTMRDIHSLFDQCTRT